MEFSTNQSDEPCECPLCTRNITLPRRASSRSSTEHSSTCSQSQKKSRQHSSTTDQEKVTLEQLKKENRELKQKLERKEEEILGEVLQALENEKDRCKSLETQIEEMNKEQEAIIDVFSEERDRRNAEEKNLRKKLQEASNTNQELLEKIRLLERKSSTGRY